MARNKAETGFRYAINAASLPMSALGQKRTLECVRAMSALPQKRTLIETVAKCRAQPLTLASAGRREEMRETIDAGAAD